MDERLAHVGVLFVLDTFEQGEFQPVPAFMPYGKIGEDEICRGLGSCEIGSTCDSDTGENRYGLGSVHFTTRDGPSNFQTCVEHKCSVITHGDINIVGKNPEFNYRGRIDWSPVGRSW